MTNYEIEITHILIHQGRMNLTILARKVSEKIKDFNRQSFSTAMQKMILSKLVDIDENKNYRFIQELK